MSDYHPGDGPVEHSKTAVSELGVFCVVVLIGSCRLGQLTVYFSVDRTKIIAPMRYTFTDWTQLIVMIHSAQ